MGRSANPAFAKIFAKADRGIRYDEATKILESAIKAQADDEEEDRRRAAKRGVRAGVTDLRTRQASKMNGFYISRNKVFGQDVPLLATKMTAAGVGWNPSKARIFRPATGEGTMFVADLYTEYRKVASTEAGAAHVLACWEREFSDRLVHCLHGPQCRHGAQCLVGKRMVDIHVLSGSVVPVWGKIESAIRKITNSQGKNLKIVRVEEVR